MRIEECLEKAHMDIKQIDGIAITYGPGLVGSLLVGVEAAKTLAYVNNIPLIPVNHMSGHIYANELVNKLTFPLIAFIFVSFTSKVILLTLWLIHSFTIYSNNLLAIF